MTRSYGDKRYDANCHFVNTHSRFYIGWDNFLRVKEQGIISKGKEEKVKVLQGRLKTLALGTKYHQSCHFTFNVNLFFLMFDIHQNRHTKKLKRNEKRKKERNVQNIQHKRIENKKLTDKPKQKQKWIHKKQANKLKPKRKNETKTNK